MGRTVESISEKIARLSDEQLAEVEMFIARFQRDDAERADTAAFAALSDSALREAWDNTDDDIYNAL
jgi:hypothetical protein